MRKHSVEQLAEWARDWGLDGYQEYDPKNREKARTQAMKRQRQREEKEQRYKEKYKN